MKYLFGLGLFFILILASSCWGFEEFMPEDTITPTVQPTVTSSSTMSTTSIPPDTTSPSPTTKPTTSSKAVSTRNLSVVGATFEYPDTWEQQNSAQSDPNILASFKDKGTGAFVQVAETEMGFVLSAEDLQAYHKAWVQAVMRPTYI
jgi:cytoskeletal protein RodZ